MNTNTYRIGDREQRPWGSWVVCDVMPTAVVKKIRVNSGCKLSYRRHQFRSERWVVVEGIATVIIDGSKSTLAYGDTIEIPRMSLHRLMNDSDSILVVIEVQYGTILSEEDIERIEDDYSKCSQSETQTSDIQQPF